MKDVVFVGGSGDDLRNFPEVARQRTGYQLFLIQRGLDPTNWKPMASVGPGCREIRVRAEGNAYRVLYVATIGNAVFVLHCFEKKTRQTPKSDIDLAQQRFRLAIESIRAKEQP